MIKVGNKVKLVKDFEVIGLAQDFERNEEFELKVGVEDAIDKLTIFGVSKDSVFIVESIDNDGDLELMGNKGINFIMYPNCLEKV